MGDTIAAFVRVVMLALAALLPLINPPGLAPIFLSMTPGASEPVRTALARRIARNSFVLLVGAMLIGSYVLLFFGLSLAVVKIAGGLLVITTAWHLIRAEQSPDSSIVATSTPRKSTFGRYRGLWPVSRIARACSGSRHASVTSWSRSRKRQANAVPHDPPPTTTKSMAPILTFSD